MSCFDNVDLIVNLLVLNFNTLKKWIPFSHQIFVKLYSLRYFVVFIWEVILLIKYMKVIKKKFPQKTKFTINHFFRQYERNDDVVLVSLSLTLNIFIRFYCRFWNKYLSFVRSELNIKYHFLGCHYWDGLNSCNMNNFVRINPDKGTINPLSANPTK